MGSNKHSNYACNIWDKRTNLKTKLITLCIAIVCLFVGIGLIGTKGTGTAGKVIGVFLVLGFIGVIMPKK